MLTRFKKRTRPSPKWVAISCFATECEKEIYIFFCIFHWFLKLEFRGWVSLLEMCIKSSYETKSLKPISVHSSEILILLLFRFKSCHRYWQRGLKRVGDVECNAFDTTTWYRSYYTIVPLTPKRRSFPNHTTLTDWLKEPWQKCYLTLETTIKVWDYTDAPPRGRNQATVKCSVPSLNF